MTEKRKASFSGFPALIAAVLFLGFYNRHLAYVLFPLKHLIVSA